MSPQQQEPQDSPDYEQIWKAGDRIIHEVFGTGQVTHVLGSGKKISLAIQFPSGQKILDPKRVSMQRIK
jgi:DNA helicase-2/ATP-dependent DNA helicase PcrA